MNEQGFAAAVQTKAQMEVLHAAAVISVAQAIRRLSSAEQDAILEVFVERVGDIPPGPTLPTPAATRFHEAVAEAAPRHARRFADEVRHVLARARELA